MTGRLRDGAVELGRVIELGRASQPLSPLGFVHSLHVFRCEFAGEAASALAHAREAVDYAERTGNQLVRIFAYHSLGSQMS